MNAEKKIITTAYLNSLENEDKLKFITEGYKVVDKLPKEPLIEYYPYEVVEEETNTTDEDEKVIMEFKGFVCKNEEDYLEIILKKENLHILKNRLLFYRENEIANENERNRYADFEDKEILIKKKKNIGSNGTRSVAEKCGCNFRMNDGTKCNSTTDKYGLCNRHKGLLKDISSRGIHPKEEEKNKTYNPKKKDEVQKLVERKDKLFMYPEKFYNLFLADNKLEEIKDKTETEISLIIKENFDDAEIEENKFPLILLTNGFFKDDYKRGNINEYFKSNIKIVEEEEKPKKKGRKKKGEE